MASPSELLRERMNEAAERVSKGGDPNKIVSEYFALNTIALVEILAALERLEQKLGS